MRGAIGLDTEVIAILVSLLSVMIAFLSLYRTRKNSEIQAKLQDIQTQIAEKQLDQLIEEEDLSGQPVFAIRTLSLSGLGDKDSPEFTVYISLSIDNTGENYLEGQFVVIGAWNQRRFLLSQGVSLEYRDPRDNDPILGKHVIKLKPGAHLELCKIHIMYIDNKGFKRIQEFSIFPEGPRGILPDEVFFEFKKIHKIVPNSLWRMPA